MSRRLRYIPPGGALVEVTTRTIHGRFLLRPSAALNDIVVGAFARAQHKYPLELCALAVLSNHYHLLAWVPDAERLARFMGHVNSKIAKEVKRRHGWGDKIWARRYDAVIIAEDETRQLRRLEYVLAQGTKEGLVASPFDWPGVHCAAALANGAPLEGYWFDRTEELRAKRRGKDVGRYEYATRERLVFAPLPCWRHLQPETYQRRIAEMIQKIERDAATDRHQRQLGVLGAQTILAQDPYQRPESFTPSPSPDFHAAPALLQVLRAAYSEFVAAYREASARLRAGDVGVRFPEGSFPPSLPFVRAGPIRAP